MPEERITLAKTELERSADVRKVQKRELKQRVAAEPILVVYFLEKSDNVFQGSSGHLLPIPTILFS